MQNQRLFSFKLGDNELYADPLKVRRVLLNQTAGKCWGIVQEVRKLQEVIAKCREEITALNDDLSVTPTTEEESKLSGEIEKSLQENKTPTTPFENYPRKMKVFGYENQVAGLCQRLATLEELLAAASMHAFGLNPIDIETGEGVTEMEAIEVLIAFLEYAEGKGLRLGN